MKNKILALLATIGLASSVTAVEINENISINGFIDGAWSNVENDGNQHDDNNIGLDEVELNFIVSAGNVDGEIHIDTTESGFGGDDGLNIEQAHFTYSFENGLSAQIGIFGSNLGFEREDPAGLYTYSRAYGNADLGIDFDGNALTTDTVGVFNLGNIDDFYQAEGIRLSYATDSLAVSIAATNGVGVSEEEQTSALIFSENNLDYEVAVTFTGLENLSLTAGFISVNSEERNGNPATDDGVISTINGSYTLDKLLIGAEYISYDPDAAGINDISAWMILADYDINDKMGVAVRFSEFETDVTAKAESDQLTIAPNYAITDSLGAILEYSSTDNGSNDQDTLALELTYTF